MSSTPLEWPGRRAGDPAHELVDSFLVMDIQDSPEWAEELATKVAEVRAGVLSSWERTGNAYRLRVSREGAVIEDLVDTESPPRQVSLDEFEAAVRAWRASLH